MDGIDCGYVGWNPESDLGNIEIWEQTLPILYLGRRIWPDSAAAGRFRSGLTYSSLLKIHGSPLYNMVSTIHQDKVFDNQGMCGGYPGPSPRFSHVSRDTNLEELISARKPLPHVEGDPDNPDMQRLVSGEFQTVDGVFLERALKDGDLFQFFYNTAGGYGDPIERDPELTSTDLEQGGQTQDVAEAVYGIVSRFEPKSRQYEIDQAATEKRRADIRADRMERGVPVREWLEGQRQRVGEKDLSEPVREMYDDIFRISERWGREFREFWELPEDFNFGTNAIR